MIDRIDRALIWPFQWLSERTLERWDVSCYRLAGMTAAPYTAMALIREGFQEPLTHIGLAAFNAAIVIILGTWRHSDSRRGEAAFRSAASVLPSFGTSNFKLRAAWTILLAFDMAFAAVISDAVSFIALAEDAAFFAGTCLLACEPRRPKRQTSAVFAHGAA